jgi:hypothetical protein
VAAAASGAAICRDLLIRGIIYQLQERPLGGLSKSIIRKLERLNLDSQASDAQKPARPISLKAGTRLVREWRGVTYTVLEICVLIFRGSCHCYHPSTAAIWAPQRS